MALEPFGSFRRSFIVREALRVAPGKLAIATGLRAALATSAPLLLGVAIDEPELSVAGLAGFGVVLADKGGAYSTRARSMATIAVTGSFATLLGALAAPHPLLATPLVLLAVGLGGFVRLFGAEATSIGTLTSVALVVALARPAEELEHALFASGLSLAGSAWAALISLVLWPLRVYRPSRLAVANSLRELARVADSFLGASDEARAQVARRELLGRTREAIEAGRAALGRSRKSRPGPSRRGEQLVALLEGADQLFGVLIALEDGLALERSEEIAGAVDEVATVVASELRRIADGLEQEQPISPATPNGALRKLIAPRAQGPFEHVPAILLRALDRSEQLLALARAIDDPSAERAPGSAVPSDLSTEASSRSLLRDNLTLDSAMFRHALRMGITTALVSLTTHALHVEHGYWATLTCLVIMQPHGAATWAKALQRVGGTVLGAGIAMAIASHVEGAHALIACVFLFVWLGMALLPLNYGAFAVFLTPGFVLLAERHAGNLDLAWVRITMTLLGASLALLGSRLLFPLSERDQLRPLMVRALDTLRALLEVASSPSPPAGLVQARRRELGLALLNAEASYQRLLTESGIAADESEALLTLLLYTHRLASGLIALAEVSGGRAHGELVAHAPELMRSVTRLREAAANRRTVGEALSMRPSRADLDEEVDRVDLLFAQLDVLRAALLRWNAGAAGTSGSLPGDLGGARA